MTRLTLLLASLFLFAGPARPGLAADHPGLPGQEGDVVPCISDYRTQVVIDGFQTDWEEEVPPTSRVTRLVAGEPEYDWTGPADASFMLWCRVGENHLYFAVVARDNHIVAPDRRRGGDRFALVFAPDSVDAGAADIRIVEIPVWPVHDGGTSTPVWQNGPDRGQPVPGARAEVSYREHGFFLEAAIPRDVAGHAMGFGPVPFAAIQHDWDHDAEREREVSIATAPFHPRRLQSLGTLHFPDAHPRIPRIAEALQLTANTTPDAEAWGRFTGDPRRKRAIALGRFLVLYGPGLPWDLVEFPLSAAHPERISRFEHLTLPLDPAEYLLVEHTETHLGVEVDVLSLFTFHTDGIERVLHQEVARRIPGGAGARASVTLSTDRGSVGLRVLAPDDLSDDDRDQLARALPDSPGPWQPVPLGDSHGRSVHWRPASAGWTALLR